MKAAAEEVINSGLYNLKTPYEDIFREKVKTVVNLFLNCNVRQQNHNQVLMT